MTPAPAPIEKSGTVILIHKQLRMDWVDGMALDWRLSDSAFRVACIIGTHFGNKSGLTYVSQETIAEVGHLSLSTVKRAVKDLEAAGYLIVRRRDVGERKDGRRVYGGRGTANEYLPAIDATQVAATDRGQRLATRARSFWDDRAAQKQVAGDVLSNANRVTNGLLSAGESSSFGPRKQVTDGLPTLTLPSEENSSRAREPSGADALGPLAAIIRASIGDDQFRAWFGKASVSAETPDSLTLALPSKFVRQEVLKRYDHKFASWCTKLGKQRIDTAVVATKGLSDGS